MYLRTLQILHLALVGGQAMFLLLAAGLVLSGKSPRAFVLPADTGHILVLVMYLLAFGALAAGNRLFNRKVTALQQQPAGEGKYSSYRAATIIRYALLEAPSLIGIVLFMLTGDYVLLGVPLLVIAVFVWLRPSRKAIIRDLKPA